MNSAQKSRFLYCISCYCILLFSLFFTSCKKQETVIGYKIPEKTYFISISESKGIIYSEGKCNEYSITQNDERPQFTTINLINSEIYAHNNFSKFIEEHYDTIRTATINLFLYDGDSDDFFDLQSIAKQFKIYEYTRFSDTNLILGFSESVLNNGFTTVKNGRKLITYEYGDSVCEIMKIVDTVSDSTLYEDPLMPSFIDNPAKEIDIPPDEIESQLIKSAYLIKNSPYLLLGKLNLGCYEYHSNDSIIYEVLPPFMTLPVQFQLGEINRLETSLLFGEKIQDDEEIFFINGMPYKKGMTEIHLSAFCDIRLSSGDSNTLDEHTICAIEEFNCNEPLNILIDADSHIIIRNQSAQQIDLINLMSLEPKYEIIKESFTIDNHFWSNLLSTLLVFALWLAVYFLVDRFIKCTFRKRILKATTDKQILKYRFLYKTIYIIFTVVSIGVFIAIWVFMTEARNSASLAYMILGIIAITFHPVSTRKSIPSGKYALFLRGFKNDNYNPKTSLSNNLTFENELAVRIKKVVKKFYAIGMTKELYSPFGAKRIYVKDSEWKNKVIDLIQRSTLIVIDFHESESCLFEIIECLNYKSKTVCIVRDYSQYYSIKNRLHTKLPEIPNDGEIYFFKMDEQEVWPYNDTKKFRSVLQLCVQTHI